MAIKGEKISDDEARQLIEARVDMHGTSTHRQPFEHMVWRNRAFFFGKQHLVQDPFSGRLRHPTQISNHKILYRANLMLGNILRSTLTVANATGEWAVPPKDGTRKQRHAAWVSTQLFKHLSYTQGMSEKDEIAILYAALDGSVIWKVFWDPDKGEKERFYLSEDNQVIIDPGPMIAERLEEEGRYEDWAPGDAVAEPVPWSQVWWDWAARERGFDTATWGATASIVSMATIEDNYGMEAASKVKPDEALAGSLYYDEAISFMSSNFGHAEAYDDPYARDEERTILAEYWEVPMARNNWKGRNIHVAGGHTLINRTNIYRDTGFPIPLVKQDWIKANGRFVGISLAEQLTSPQFHYNEARATISQHRRIYGHPAYLVPEDSGIPLGHMTLEPGVVHSYKPSGGKIETGPTPQLPKEVVEDVQFARSEMAEISSQQAIDATKMPGQLRSAPALDAMFAERNKLLVHPAKNFLSAKEKVGRQLLALAKKFYEEDRIISYIGDDRKWRVAGFVAADVSTDLRVQVDPNRVLKPPSLVKAEVLEMLQLGAVNPQDPDDRIAIFKALEFGGAEELIADKLQEEENQEREINEMISNPMRFLTPHLGEMDPQGAPPKQGLEVNEYDDHKIHHKVLLRFMRSQEFRDLDPLTRTLIRQHAQQHKQILDEQMLQEMMIAQAMQGGPGEKGSPSPPKPAAPAMAG